MTNRFQSLPSSTPFDNGSLAESHQVSLKLEGVARVYDTQDIITQQGDIMCLDGLEFYSNTSYGAAWRIYVTRLTRENKLEQAFFWLSAEEKTDGIRERNSDLRSLMNNNVFPLHGFIVEKSFYIDDKQKERSFVRFLSADEPFSCACGMSF